MYVASKELVCEQSATWTWYLNISQSVRSTRGSHGDMSRSMWRSRSMGRKSIIFTLNWDELILKNEEHLII